MIRLHRSESVASESTQTTPNNTGIISTTTAAAALMPTKTAHKGWNDDGHISLQKRTLSMAYIQSLILKPRDYSLEASRKFSL